MLLATGDAVLSLFNPLGIRSLFDLFRYVLGTAGLIYTTIITVQSIYSWIVFLNSNDRYTALLRRYIIVQALRLRFRAFYGDLLICALLCVALGLLWWLHVLVNRGVI